MILVVCGVLGNFFPDGPFVQNVEKRDVFYQFRGIDGTGRNGKAGLQRSIGWPRALPKKRPFLPGKWQK